MLCTAYTCRLSASMTPHGTSPTTQSPLFFSSIAACIPHASSLSFVFIFICIRSRRLPQTQKHNCHIRISYMKRRSQSDNSRSFLLDDDRQLKLFMKCLRRNFLLCWHRQSHHSDALTSNGTTTRTNKKVSLANRPNSCE